LWADPTILAEASSAFFDGIIGSLSLTLSSRIAALAFAAANDENWRHDDDEQRSANNEERDSGRCRA
jgi:hypothetical protein